MIVLFTDFGVRGPYVGQMKAVLATEAPEARVIDLMHDAPAFDPQFAAYLLTALVEELPKDTVIVAVVDPGVGHRDRRPVILRADDRIFVGPDNGLLAIAARRAAKVEWREITWRPRQLSATFHGRDLFAPVAAALAKGDDPGSRPLAADTAVGGDWPDDLGEVIYIDDYGNAMTGMRAVSLPENVVLKARDRTIHHARTFSDVKKGDVIWYANSIGLVEIAVNKAHADAQLGIEIGTRVLALSLD